MAMPSAVERVYRLHMASMGIEERSKYEDKVAGVEWDQKEQVYIVRFESGDWWHYDVATETWY